MSRAGTMRWETAMLELLIEQRGEGQTDFALAWRHAQRLCEIPRPRDYIAREADADWRPYSTFFREACRREWLGLVTVDYLGLREMLAESGLAASRPRQSPHGTQRVVLLA